MKKIDLQNKRILYIGPLYFQYDQYFIKKLIELKAEVDVFEIEPKKDSICSEIVVKLKSRKSDQYLKDYYDKILNKTDYDYVLVRTGFQLGIPFLKKLRALNPNAKFINFHWDSIKPLCNYLPAINYFDKIYSFDYKDCEANNDVTYLPLFYIDEYSDHISAKHNGSEKIDLLFIGSWRDDERYRLINMTKAKCTQNNLNFYYYLYYSFYSQLLAIKKGSFPRESKNRLLSHKAILKLFSASNTIIDFPSSFQSGLTIRTFEALGAGKKIITTNRNILSEPFYDPEYINILDADNFNLDIDFIRHKPAHSIKSRMEDYSLEIYVNKLLQ
jgi:hypothetical protein